MSSVFLTPENLYSAVWSFLFGPDLHLSCVARIAKRELPCVRLSLQFIELTHVLPWTPLNVSNLYDARVLWILFSSVS